MRWVGRVKMIEKRGSGNLTDGYGVLLTIPWTFDR